ncbi:hypothetical protein MY4824_007905 [Beauveria thailandica]
MSFPIIGPSLDGERNQTVAESEAPRLGSDRLATYGVAEACSTTRNVTGFPFVGTQGCHARTIATAGRLEGNWGWLVIDSSSFN